MRNLGTQNRVQNFKMKLQQFPALQCRAFTYTPHSNCQAGEFQHSAVTAHCCALRLCSNDGCGERSSPPHIGEVCMLCGSRSAICSQICCSQPSFHHHHQNNNAAALHCRNTLVPVNCFVLQTSNAPVDLASLILQIHGHCLGHRVLVGQASCADSPPHR